MVYHTVENRNFLYFKKKKMQSKINLSHYARYYSHIELKRLSQNDCHILNGFIVETCLYVYISI